LPAHRVRATPAAAAMVKSFMVGLPSHILVMPDQRISERLVSNVGPERRMNGRQRRCCEERYGGALDKPAGQERRACVR
jgi:hypothetical protein